MRFNLDTDESGALFTVGSYLTNYFKRSRDNWLQSCIPSSLIMSSVQGR
jgi:hypothetical protein